MRQRIAFACPRLDAVDTRFGGKKERKLPLRFLQLLPNFAFFVTNVAQMALEKW